MKLLDLQGKTFGRLTVLRRDTKTVDERVRWLCRCSCGQRVSVRSNSLVLGLVTSCGCLHRELLSKRSLVDMAGQTFGRLTVFKRGKRRKGVKHGTYLCRCACGQLTNVSRAKLKVQEGGIKSCGCLLRERSRLRNATLMSDPEIKARQAASLRVAYQNPLLRQKMSRITKRLWADSSRRKKFGGDPNDPRTWMTYREKQERGMLFIDRDKRREKLSEIRRKQWQEPEYRARVLRAQRTTSKRKTPTKPEFPLWQEVITSKEQVRDILRRRFIERQSYSTIAHDYGFTSSAVVHVCRGRTHKEWFAETCAELHIDATRLPRIQNRPGPRRKS